MTPARIAVVVSGFPRRSETFVLNDLLALERAGTLAVVLATKPAECGPHQPGASRLRRRVLYLPAGSAEHQAAFGYTTLKRQRVTGVHGYFAHHPASVAADLATRLRVPFGFGAHAKDLRKRGPDSLAMLGDVAVGITACNADAASSVRDAGHVPHVIPHGVDLRRFSPRSDQRRSDCLRVLAVGRLVEKKGFDTLIDAAARLTVPFALRVVGDGVERPALWARAVARGIEQYVGFVGAVTHRELPAHYAWADTVAVPSIVDREGDRDGLPNVALEAMASGRVVVASDTPALRMAVQSGVNGVLVRPGAAVELADALQQLALDEPLRIRISQAARRTMEREFALPDCTRRFSDLLARWYA